MSPPFGKFRIAHVGHTLAFVSASLFVVACGNRPLSVGPYRPSANDSAASSQNPTSGGSTQATPAPSSAPVNPSGVAWYDPNKSTNTQLSGTTVKLANGATSGSFQSPVFSTSSTPQTLTFKADLPYGAPLPEGGTGDQGYTRGFTMNQNNLLLHFHEQPASTTISDRSGMGYNGSCSTNNCPTFNPSGGPFPGVGSATFNGSHSVTFGTSPSVTGKGPMALSLWFNTTSTQAQDIIKQSGGGSGTQYSGEWAFGLGIDAPTHDNLVVKGTPGVPHAWFWDGDGGTPHYEDVQSTVATPLNDGAWHHAVITRETNGNLTLYIDGAMVGQNTAPHDIVNLQTRNFTVGMGGNNGFNGALSEFALFSNRALTAQEATDLNARGRGSVQFQVRTCQDPTCANSSWSTTGGTNGLFGYSANPWTLGLPSGPYFQFQAKLNGATGISPQLTSFAFSPSPF